MEAVLEKLRTTPRVEYNEERKALITKDGQVYRGVCPLIEQHFSSPYVYTPPTSPPQTLSGTVKKKKKEGGIKLGTTVDEQLTRVIRQLSRTGESISKWLIGMSRLPREQRIHSRTRSVLVRLSKLGWRPAGAQVPVSSPKSKVATLADAVLYNPKKQRYVVIEGKSWQEGGYNTAPRGRRMRGLFRKQLDSPANKHQLQVFFTALLFARTFNIPFANVDAMVVRVTSSAVYTYPLAEWARVSAPAFSHLL